MIVGGPANSYSCRSVLTLKNESVNGAKDLHMAYLIYIVVFRKTQKYNAFIGPPIRKSCT